MRRRDYSEPRRWQPLTDAEWDAFLPFVLVQDRPGRLLKGARRRMDAVFWMAAAGCPWRELPARFGKPDTVSRNFRRLAGLWERLLRALALPDALEALRAVEHWVCCACRRATRLRGLRIIVLARRLGFLSALKGPSWYLARPGFVRTGPPPRLRGAGPRLPGGVSHRPPRLLQRLRQAHGRCRRPSPHPALPPAGMTPAAASPDPETATAGSGRRTAPARRVLDARRGD